MHISPKTLTWRTLLNFQPLGKVKVDSGCKCIKFDVGIRKCCPSSPNFACSQHNLTFPVHYLHCPIFCSKLSVIFTMFDRLMVLLGWSAEDYIRVDTSHKLSLSLHQQSNV